MPGWNRTGLVITASEVVLFSGVMMGVKGDVRLGQAEGWGQGSNWQDRLLAVMAHSTLENCHF